MVDNYKESNEEPQIDPDIFNNNKPQFTTLVQTKEKRKTFN